MRSSQIYINKWYQS